MARPRPKQATVFPLVSALEPIPGARAGWIVGLAANGQPRVDFEGNRAGPIVARTIVAIPAPDPDRRLEVLLVFESSDPLRPVVVGLMRGLEDGARSLSPAKAVVDAGLVLEAVDEVELRCGKASTILRRNGRVVIRGARIESRAAGANKIRGGSVQIN